MLIHGGSLFRTTSRVERPRTKRAPPPWPRSTTPPLPNIGMVSARSAWASSDGSKPAPSRPKQDGHRQRVVRFSIVDPVPRDEGCKAETPRALREHRAQGGGVSSKMGRRKTLPMEPRTALGPYGSAESGKRDERRDARGFRDAHDGAEIAGNLECRRKRRAGLGSGSSPRDGRSATARMPSGRIQVAHAPEQPLGKLHSWNTLGHRPRKCARDHHRLDLCTSMNGGRGGIHELSAFEQKLVFALARLRETANRLDERVLRAFDALHLSLAEGERPGYHSKTL